MIQEVDPTVVPTYLPVENLPEGDGGGRTYSKMKPSVWIPIAIVTGVLGIALAIWLLYIAGKRKRNRAGLHAQDNAEAIRNMFLYARRWRKLHPSAEEIPQEVKEIWLEAAYSEHEMTDAQVKAMRSYMRKSALATWKAMKWWQRLLVRYYHGL